MPHLDQTTGRDFHSQVKVKRTDDLAERQPLQKVQHRRKHQRAISKRTTRQDVRQFGFDSLLARRAVIAVQDVFAAAGSLIAGSLEWPVTIRAAWKDVFSRAIRFGQRLSRASGVTGLSASFLLAFPILRLGRRFREGRNCSGRCVGADDLRRMGDTLLNRQQREDQALRTTAYETTRVGNLGLHSRRA